MHENDGAMAFINHRLTEVKRVGGFVSDFPAGLGLGQDAGEHHVPVRQSDECGDPLAGAGDQEFVGGHGAWSEGLAGILDRHFGLDDEVSINPDPGSIGDPIVDVGTGAPAAEADGVAMLGSYRSAEGPVAGDFDLVEIVLKDVVHGVGGVARLLGPLRQGSHQVARNNLKIFLGRGERSDAPQTHQEPRREVGPPAGYGEMVQAETRE